MSCDSRDLTWDDFLKVEICLGAIVQAEICAKARKPVYKMLVDFGPLGTRKTSAQITDSFFGFDWPAGDCCGQLPAKQIANIKSECLILAAVGDDHVVTLVAPERCVPNGRRVAYEITMYDARHPVGEKTHLPLHRMSLS
jgi:tRNA-binding protein